MELDKRIKEGKRPLTCFDLKEASDFLEKTGYFTNELDYFSDLSEVGCFSEVQFGRLLKTNNNKRCAFKYLSMDGSYENSYRFFLPEDWVLPKEKKYRPYTVMEFIKEYPLGSYLHFRPKSKTIEMHRIIDGYNDCLNGAGTLFLCGVIFSMSELYDNYEIFKNGEWQPFGIKE